MKRSCITSKAVWVNNGRLHHRDSRDTVEAYEERGKGLNIPSDKIGGRHAAPLGMLWPSFPVGTILRPF